jgi:hypothetical protein
VATLPPVEDELEGGFVSALDPSGARMVLLVERNPGGGARLFEMVVDEAKGVLDCHVYTTGRSAARRFVRELTRRERFAVTVAPADSVRALLARIAARGEAEGASARSFQEWRSHLVSAPPEARSPGELALDALGDEVDPARLERAAELARQGDIGPWLPSRELLEHCAEKLRETASGRLIVSGAARRQRVEGAMAECLAEVFPSDSTGLLAVRLRESAYVLWRSEREADARALLAAARQLTEGPAGESPLARALLDKALAPLLESLEEEDQASLIVKGDPGLLMKP